MITLPQQDTTTDFSLVFYENPAETIKSRISFTQNVFSFLVEGYKEIYAQTPKFITGNEFALVTSSCCLMTEKRRLEERAYNSVLLFFSNEALKAFQLRYHDLISKIKAEGEGTFDVQTFPYDTYSNTFRRSLMLLIDSGGATDTELVGVKFNEIMLYLLKRYPERVVSLFNNLHIESEIKLRATVENNLFHQVTLEELAFLCNMSLSTFKRYFQHHYGTSPKRYILSKRMLLAKQLMERGERPASIYGKVGYQTLSSFAKAYKSYFGIQPHQVQD